MMTRLLLCALALLFPCLAAPAADEAPARWKLADLYVSQAAWDVDAARVESELKSLAAHCRGRLGESARRLAQCLDRSAAISQRQERLAVYANLLRDEDTGLAAGRELNQRADRLGSSVEEATAFMRPQLLALGRTKVERFVAGESSLRRHRHPLRTILRTSPHTLDARGEELLATLGTATNASAEIYTILANADLPWPSIQLANGREVRIDHAGYEKHRQSSDRAERQRAMQAFFGRWKDYERSFGVTFYEMLKRDAAYAKARRYPDALSRALDGDNVPREVLDMLVAQTNANLPTLHRYFRLRARLLGVPDMGYHDIYPPLVASDATFPIERSQQLMLASLHPLGESYVEAVRKGLAAGWMDVHPRPRKYAGAYVNDVYDAHPYVLLNHNDDYESLTTLAHEWGHAMHSVLANQAQPYVTADYATFIAEIASTLNEALLTDHMLKIASSDDERLFVLGSALETLRGTFFRQTMFAEFERDVHARVERGEALAGESISKLYLEVLRRYHGDAVRIDELYGIEWAYIPHFYNGFYVFQYATSIAAASLFADAIVGGKPGARERFLGLLRAGGSDDPYKLVKAAGVDLATPAPYRAIVARMDRIMDEIEAILARRPAR